MRNRFVVAALLLPLATGGLALATLPVQAAGQTVTIAGHKFMPAAIRIKPGDTVTFVNKDSVAHTATAADGAFDTGQLGPGQSAKVQVAAGVHPYACRIHPSMKGSVTVK